MTHTIKCVYESIGQFIKTGKDPLECLNKKNVNEQYHNRISKHLKDNVGDYAEHSIQWEK